MSNTEIEATFIAVSNEPNVEIPLARLQSLVHAAASGDLILCQLRVSEDTEPFDAFIAVDADHNDGDQVKLFPLAMWYPKELLVDTLQVATGDGDWKLFSEVPLTKENWNHIKNEAEPTHVETDSTVH